MLIESARAILIFLHLLLFAGVFMLILWCEFGILKMGIGAMPFKKVTDATAWVLSLLWITGLSIIYLDTRFDIPLILGNPKLVMKLLCVSVLTWNGLILHFVCFKKLMNHERMGFAHATLFSVGGAISTANWLLAAFIGSASVLQQVPLPQLLLIYCLMMFLAISAAVFVSPWIQTKINAHEVVFVQT